MLTKSLTKYVIASAAIAASLALVPAGSAEARSHVDFNVGIGIGAGGFYAPGYVGYVGVYEDPYAGVSCGEARSIVKGSGFYKVSAIDCSAPNYKFIAWQAGAKYKVRVNRWGNITGVTPL